MQNVTFKTQEAGSDASCPAAGLPASFGANYTRPSSYASNEDAATDRRRICQKGSKEAGGQYGSIDVHRQSVILKGDSGLQSTATGPSVDQKKHAMHPQSFPRGWQCMTLLGYSTLSNRPFNKTQEYETQRLLYLLPWPQAKNGRTRTYLLLCSTCGDGQ